MVEGWRGDQQVATGCHVYRKGRLWTCCSFGWCVGVCVRHAGPYAGTKECTHRAIGWLPCVRVNLGLMSMLGHGHAWSRVRGHLPVRSL